MEHTALLKAARDLRTRLTAIPATALVMAPGLKAAVPLISTVIEGVEDLADRIQLVEARMNALEGLPPASALRALVRPPANGSIEPGVNAPLDVR